VQSKLYDLQVLQSWVLPQQWRQNGLFKYQIKMHDVFQVLGSSKYAQHGVCSDDMAQEGSTQSFRAHNIWGHSVGSELLHRQSIDNCQRITEVMPSVSLFCTPHSGSAFMGSLYASPFGISNQQQADVRWPSDVASGQWSSSLSPRFGQGHGLESVAEGQDQA